MSAPHDAQSHAPHCSSLSVGFFSLGCAKNLVDSQIMASTLLAEGLVLAPSPEAADVVLVNTCAFIEDAREESVDTILAACRLKEEGPCRAVIVAGCLAQRYKESLQDSLPEVDAFVGIDELDRIGKIVRQLETARQPSIHVSQKPHRLFEPTDSSVVFTGGPFAYLKIAEGCNHRCAFCAIPGIRGPHRSREPGGIVKEAKQLLAQGFRELNVISQDTTAYGRDLANPTRLSELLKLLGGLSGTFRVRVLYGYPGGMTDDLLRVIRDMPRVCPYLDIPIQHSHPELLAAMQRGGTTEAVRSLVGRARETVPDITIRTTCLVGFPGETDKHFQHLREFLAQMAFDHLGVFTFSPEEDTPAAGMAGQVSRELAGQRRDCLLMAQRDIVQARARTLVGRETELLLERPDEDTTGRWIGRTPRQAPEVDGETFVTGVGSQRRPGDFIRVRYIGAADYDMLAEEIA